LPFIFVMCCLIRRHGWEDLLVFRRIKSKIKLRCVTAEAGAHDDCVYVTPEPGPVTCVAGLPLERISRLDGGAAGSSPPSSVSKSLSARCIYMRPRKGASTFERLSCLLSAARTITQIMLWRCSPTPPVRLLGWGEKPEAVIDVWPASSIQTAPVSRVVPGSRQGCTFPHPLPLAVDQKTISPGPAAAIRKRVVDPGVVGSGTGRVKSEKSPLRCRAVHHCPPRTGPVYLDRGCAILYQPIEKSTEKNNSRGGRIIWRPCCTTSSGW
jgi:hypothetical protein